MARKPYIDEKSLSELSIYRVNKSKEKPTILDDFFLIPVSRKDIGKNLKKRLETIALF